MRVHDWEEEKIPQAKGVNLWLERQDEDAVGLGRGSWAGKYSLSIKKAEALAKDASITLTLLLAGMGGALAYSINGLDGCSGGNVLNAGDLGLSL